MPAFGPYCAQRPACLEIFKTRIPCLCLMCTNKRHYTLKSRHWFVVQGLAHKQRQALAPEYLQQRKARQARKLFSSDCIPWQPEVSDERLSPLLSKAKQPQKQEQKQRRSLHALAEALGCHVVIAPAAYEADDFIQALCSCLASGTASGVVTSCGQVFCIHSFWPGCMLATKGICKCTQSVLMIREPVTTLALPVS